MMLAATMAGVGFGSAGVHIPHACAYPTAALKHDFRPVEHPLVPHGHSVIVFGPAAFRRTYTADPTKHHRAAALLAGTSIADPDEETLPRLLIGLMRDVGAPSGVRALGYDDQDVEDLVAGALRQRRLLDVAPIEVGPDDLEAIVRDSMAHW